MPETLTYDHPTSRQTRLEEAAGETAAVDAVIEALDASNPSGSTENLTKEMFPEKPLQKGAPPEVIPENIKKLRQEDSARQMFGAQGQYQDIPLEKIFKDVEGISDEEKAVAAHEYREIFADFGLSSIEAKEMVSLAQELHTQKPDAATEEAWQKQAAKRLVEVHGKGAAATLDLARQLVARDPRIKHILEVTRLGNHPRVIEHVIGIAMRQRTKGRL